MEFWTYQNFLRFYLWILLFVSHYFIFWWKSQFDIYLVSAEVYNLNTLNNYTFQHFFQSGPAANKQTGAGGSHMTIEWTNQHGCGGNEDTDPQKQNCNMVLQFMCEDAVENIPGRDGSLCKSINIYRVSESYIVYLY